MNVNFYRNLKRKNYRVYLLSLGFPTTKKHLQNNYEIAEAEQKDKELGYIKAK